MRLDNDYSIRFDHFTDEAALTAELGGGWLATYFFAAQGGGFVIKGLTIHREDGSLPAGGLTSTIARDATRTSPPLRVFKRFVSGELQPLLGYQREEPPLPTSPREQFLLEYRSGGIEKWQEFEVRRTEQKAAWTAQLGRPARVEIPSRARRLVETMILYEALKAENRAPNERVAEILTERYGRRWTAAHVRDDMRAVRTLRWYEHPSRQGKPGGKITPEGERIARDELGEEAQ
jgi:hypothetical protein